MSMKDLNKEFEKLFQNRINENKLQKKLDQLIDEYGINQINLWRNLSNRTKNTLLHELVEQNYPDTVKHMIQKYQLRTFFKRDSDQLTPIELAFSNQNWKIFDLLLEFGDEKTREQVSKDISLKKQKEQMMNIVWMDLEFTSFDNPQILECAVIITNKDLQEIKRKQWIIHFDQDFLSGLSDWHQNAFKDIDEGGNGLFNDVIDSKIRKEQVEIELLDLLKEYCPEKACPLAGSSIHVDKRVLKLEMPSVDNYLHYRVIDVSSFTEIMKRWTPKTASQFSKEISSNGRDIVNHRAMDDIEWSIEMMKLFRPLLTSKQFSKGSSRIKDESISENLPLIPSSFDRTKLNSEEKHLIKRIEFEQTFHIDELHLNTEEQRIYNENPHLREVFLNHEQIIFHQEDFTLENRLLNQSIISKTKLRQIQTTENWTQRKLLLIEIEFLTKFYNEHDKILIIYAGAAPGSHINYLSSLFPNVLFNLYDDKTFYLNYENNNQIKIFKENFTNDLAMKYQNNKTNEKILFISNYRTFTNYENVQNDIDYDMKNQMKWISILKPFASLVRFSLPRLNNSYEFYQGILFNDLWSSTKSMECRILIENNPKLILYNYNQFEKSILYFHQYQRTLFYQHDLDHIETEGLDHCYDCTAEIFILKNYFFTIQHINDEKQLYQSIAQLSYEISKNISDKYRLPFLKGKRSLNIIPKN